MIPVPSAPPENVSAEAVSSTQILLTWTAVPESEQNGLILGYKVLQLEFHAYLIFNALPGCFCIYLLVTWWIFIVFVSQLEKIQEVCL